MTPPRLRVWAPAATRVEVVTDSGRRPLERAEGGHWEGDAPPAGIDYRVALDGGEPRKDPRSRLQPDGVHGPSRAVDPGGFTWTDQAWRGIALEDVILYELHVGTFTPEGSLDSAIARLDHLVDLGVTAVELMPLAAFPGDRGWGYDGVDLWAVHAAYGGPEALSRFVDACHGRGLAVVLDVVYNHLGPDGNVLASFGPYFTDRYSTPWGDAVNVDGAGSDGVRAHILENALMWLREHHIDGLRLDAVHAILDTSAYPVLEELSAAVAELAGETGRRLLLFAESDANDVRLVTPRDAGGIGMDAHWADDLHHALHSLLTGEQDGYYADYGGIDAVAAALVRGVVYDGRWSAAREHRVGRPYGDTPRTRLVACTQNHDQIGNRAAGERLAALVDAGALRVAAATLLLAPHTPLLFMGEEWAASTPFQYFIDHQDPELAAAVSRGRRQEFRAFGWAPDAVPDPQDPATFTRSRLDWDEPARAPHAAMLDWYRELISLRRGIPALRDGDPAGVRVKVPADRALVLERGPVVLAWNRGDADIRIDLPAGATVRMAFPERPERDSGGRTILAPGAVAVLLTGPTSE